MPVFLLCTCKITSKAPQCVFVFWWLRWFRWRFTHKSPLFQKDFRDRRIFCRILAQFRPSTSHETVHHFPCSAAPAAVAAVSSVQVNHTQESRTSHGMRNELSLRLKWLHRAVQCTRFVLTRGQQERCESRSSLQGPANTPRPPWS
jgi:hypothetical protein